MKTAISCGVEKIRQWWYSLSISRRFYLFVSFLVGAAFSAAILLYLGMHSLMTATDQILDTNTISLEFQIRMEQENLAFAEWADGSKTDAREELVLAAAQTAEAVENLELLPQRCQPTPLLFSQIWDIRNSYRFYERQRDKLLSMKRGDADFPVLLYRLYEMQNYLVQYGNRLTQTVIQQGDLAYQEKQQRYAFFPLMLAALGIGTLLVLFLTGGVMDRLFIRPVIQLCQDVRKIADRDFGGSLPVRMERDEIGELIDAFESMKQATFSHIETLRENSELQLQLEKMRLQILKSQINPHFLFNTLNTISCMAQLEDAETTDQMILALSRLFQYSLQSDETVTPLLREFKIAEDYLYLQKMRFENRIEYELSMAPETSYLLVPSFMLQPLVENAITHGIAEKEKGGSISVKSWLEGEKLWLRIEDTGVGMDPDTLREVRLGKKRPASGHGIGLGNIRKRIQLMYQDGEFMIDSVQGEGTVIQIGFTETNKGEQAT